MLADLRAALGDGSRACRAARARALRPRRRRRRRATPRRCASRATRRELAEAVRIAARHDRPFVARGSGTGLAGGATPVGDPLVIVTTQLNRILEVDAEQRVAWVEPGVLNLDLSRAVAHLGLHYAPDPSSQQACTIGGNVATNAGGPHCLASGVTADARARGRGRARRRVRHDARRARARPARATTCAAASSAARARWASRPRIAVRLTPNPPAVRTLLLDFTSIEDAGAAVSGIIAAGIVPAALEMMDARDHARGRGLRRRRLPARRRRGAARRARRARRTASTRRSTVVERVGLEHGARTVRVAADDAERALLWKGRKSAFGAIARIAPDYYLHDAVVPADALVDVLRAGVRDRRRATSSR